MASQQSDPQILKAIRARIREARLARGWSQERLAEALHLSPQAVQNYETGRRQLSLLTVRRVARALSVEYAWLLGVEPPGMRKGEDELLQLWRRISAEQRAALMVLFKGLGRQ